jgi:putative glutathione S-transferase
MRDDLRWNVGNHFPAQALYPGQRRLEDPMGKLVDGQWTDQWYDTGKSGGKFVRGSTSFRNWITADGSAGPSGDGGFPAESGRYHLYVSLACPWAHRTLIFRALKGLASHVGVSVVHPDMLSDGWTFATDFDGATGDRLAGRRFLRDLYTDAQPDISGRVTVPVLWDTQRATIVSNESAEILRMFNDAFNGLTGNRDDYYPQALRPRIDEINARIYDTVNNGVYKAGFATSQAAYDEAVRPLFDSLDWIEDLLSQHRYLAGDRITEADWRLFTTMIRFDKVYHGHFKCNLARVIDYPNLWAHTRELYQWPGIAETVDLDHIVRHYHYSHESINPHRIVPITPDLDLSRPHGRDQLDAA